MKRFLLAGVALPVLIVLLSGAAPVLATEKAADKPVVTLRADPSCPSNCEPGSDRPGYVVEMAQRVFEDAGYPVDYKLLSWARTIVEVRAGNIDGFIAGIKGDAPDFIFPEEPSGILVQACASRRADHWRWTGPASLTGKLLGYIPDYQYFPALKDYITTYKNNPKRTQAVAMMNADELNLKKIDAKRIDVTCGDQLTLKYYVHMLGMDERLEVTLVGEPAEPEYVAFGPTNPRSKALAAVWDQGIRKLRASGELQKIMTRYGLEDWAPSKTP